MSAGPTIGFWLEFFLVLGAGACVVVAIAALVSWRLPSAAWKRAVWQIGFLALLALLLVELTGASRGIPELVNASSRRVNDRALPPPPSSPGRRESLDLVTSEPEESPETGAGPVAGGARTAVPRGKVRIHEPAALERRPMGQGSAETLTSDGLLGPVTSAVATASRPLRGTTERGSWWPGAIWLLGSALLAARRILGFFLLFLFHRRRPYAERDLSRSWISRHRPFRLLQQRCSSLQGAQHPPVRRGPGPEQSSRLRPARCRGALLPWSRTRF